MTLVDVIRPTDYFFVQHDNAQISKQYRDRW